MNIIQKYLYIIILLETNLSQSVVINQIDIEKFPSTHKVLVEILQFCHNNYGTVFVSMDSSNLHLCWIQNLLSTYALILHEGKLNFNYTTHYTQEIDAVVLVAQSTKNLKNMIHNLSTMVQWDLTTPIFIFNEKMNDCKTAEVILKKTWHYEFLNSYYLCFDKRKHNLFIYTYNPFTNRAPSLWKYVNQKYENHHRWTMFHRKYVKENVCQDFYFDRTKFLDGYEITVTCWPRKNASSTAGNFYNHSTYHQNGDLCSDLRNTVNALVTGLNVTLKIYSQSHNWNKTANSTESLKILKNEIYNNSSGDLILIREKLTSDDSPSNLTKTNIMDWSELGIVTYNKGNRTFIEKILDFYGFSILTLTLFILLVTFFVIWMTEKKKISFSIFEIIRLIISQTLHSQIKTMSLRIFFCVIFIYFIVLQALFNGHIAKFLTKPERRSQADTLTALHDLGYTSIYNTTSMINLIPPSGKTKATTGTLIQACLMYIINNDTSAACISRYSTLHRMVRRFDISDSKKNFYISQKTFGIHYAHFTIRQKWSLRKKINKMFALIIESGIRGFWNQNLLYYYTHKEKRAEAISVPEARPIKFEDLVFIFIFLGIGLSCATISFFTEKWLSRRNDKFNREKNITSI